MDNDGRFPDDSPVGVRSPRTEREETGDRSAWPWLPGSILEQCGPDEWYVCVEVRELADQDGLGGALVFHDVGQGVHGGLHPDDLAVPPGPDDDSPLRQRGCLVYTPPASTRLISGYLALRALGGPHGLSGPGARPGDVPHRYHVAGDLVQHAVAADPQPP